MNTNIPLVIIPCMGVGQRFRDAGERTPKPFIKVHGEEMVYRSSRGVVRSLDHMHIQLMAMPEDFQGHFGVDQDLSAYHPYGGTVRINGKTRGAADTVHKAVNHIEARQYTNDSSRPLVVADCDTYTRLTTEARNKLVDDWSSGEPFAGAAVFSSSEPRFSYVTYRNGRVVGVKEKVVSRCELAISGLYFFSSIELFRLLYLAYRKTNPQGEHYMSGLLEVHCRRGGTVNTYGTEAVFPMGTPEDIQALPVNEFLKETSSDSPLHS